MLPPTPWPFQTINLLKHHLLICLFALSLCELFDQIYFHTCHIYQGRKFALQMISTPKGRPEEVPGQCWVMGNTNRQCSTNFVSKNCAFGKSSKKTWSINLLTPFFFWTAELAVKTKCCIISNDRLPSQMDYNNNFSYADFCGTRRNKLPAKLASHE